MDHGTAAAHAMRFGAEVQAGGGVRFALWAPGCEKVRVQRVEGDGRCSGSVELQGAEDGWHEALWSEARPGMRYRFDVGQGLGVPDPASRHNPQGVHGPSEVVDPRAYAWGDAAWRGRPWHEAVVYELHVGCFTPEGTLDAAARRLPQLRELGVTAVELMPLAAFSGQRGWGYDGVLPFAPHAAYGTPAQLKRFVDSAHGVGLMVLLDVVYNHLGPDGNYLHAWCPAFYDRERRTPWGDALAFDGAAPQVRRFFIDNALYWVHEYRFDGLRLDAVHAIGDRSPSHLVEDIAAALCDGPGREREIHLVLENDDNAARWLARDDGGRARVCTAQWNDDWHHAAHVLASGERDGYYAEHARTPMAGLARALAEGFAWQGEPSAWRGGAPRGEPSAHLPPSAFVAFLQNHDQVGNRAFGERLDALASAAPGARGARVELLLACLLLSPQVPMLFMGEEFAATTPFLYFCDYEGALADAVREGRQREFAAFAAARGPVPDPNDAQTFAASRLRWADAERPAGQRRGALVRRLLALRREHLQPHLQGAPHGGRVLQCDAAGLRVEWPLGGPRTWTMRLRFGAPPCEWPLRAGEEEVWRCAGVVGGAADGSPAVDQLLVTWQPRVD